MEELKGLTVIKRDGRYVQFNSNRIKDAIRKAYEEVYKNDEKFKEDVVLLLPLIENKLKNKEETTVEEIQDIVVDYLSIADGKVGRAYEEYRNTRSIIREYKTPIYKKLDKVINAKDILNSNANVDEASFGGRKFETAGTMMKKIALDTLVPKEVAKAHIENRGYIHDLDSYAVGMHNCLFPDMKKLLTEGFSTRNGDVRGANSLSTAMQQVAVIFQVQSQDQFGGVGSIHIDYDLEDFVDISFRKYIQEGQEYINDVIEDINENITLEDYSTFNNYDERVLNYAFKKLDKEGTQSAQGLYHNLNTLESRPGSQVPFTSINFGRRDTVRSRMIDVWLLKASLDGIGKFHRTSIFPISIFQYKKGVNDVEGTPNYNVKKLAIESMTKRIYPNWANADWSGNTEDPNNPDTVFGTMGCRTLVGYDRHGMGYSKVGRGNVTPYTINLIKIGIKHGICLGEREVADLEGFWNELDEMLHLASDCLVSRFSYICKQSPKSAEFMYKNKTALGGEFNSDTCVYDVMKHGSQAIGYIGIAEMCQALFGKDHSDNEEVCNFAVSVVEHIYNYCKEASEKYNLNFGCYATPAESLCHTVMKGNRELKGLKDEFGIIPNVTDHEFATNSHHVPVWKHVDIFKKLQIESRFTKFATSGCITYVELDSDIVNNPEAIEQIIDYAFKELDIPYLAFNFPIDTCLDCGYQAEFNEECPMCHSRNIEQLRRVTGYLTTDYRKFNKGKQEEVKERFKHSTITNFEPEDN